ncbi:MAG: AraC family transcriptional regulator [Calditrichaeota bacterium]|nr:AraC family transcriptional regulator [Calditrichota bacterium]MCB0305630.1 AraC family transcriptional regulator [Calditrichota bacterium]MCB9090467.1 AraC family transcriptional regulator [Calditrichia bacterium]
MKPVSVKLTTSPQSSFKFKRIKLASFEFNWHCHPEYEIMLMLRSKGKRFIGDNISYYQPGDLFFIGPNLPHTWYASNGSRGKQKFHEAILIQFPENFAGLDVHRVPELKSLQQLFASASRGLQFHGEIRRQVMEKMLEMEALEGLERLLKLIEILDLLGRAEREQREVLSSIDFTRGFQPDEQSRIDRVCTYINRNYREQLRLEDAAEIANMSVTAFSRFFKKSTGKTFIKYVNELRIGQACKLLIESELTIAEICYKVGFNNLSNFNRRFFERHEISPKRYRQEFGVGG